MELYRYSYEYIPIWSHTGIAMDQMMRLHTSLELAIELLAQYYTVYIGMATLLQGYTDTMCGS